MRYSKIFLIRNTYFIEQTQVTTSLTTKDMRHSPCEEFEDVYNIDTGYDSCNLLACHEKYISFFIF